MPPDVTNEADVNADPYVPVGEFFAERSVFVTGATGFLGKVLVEKLLRSCPGVKVIYLLMRPKRGRGLEERLADIVNSPLFDRLKEEQPSALNKIIPIQGDIGEPDLGISLPDQETLTQNVSVVFHSAATVKFEEPLKDAFQINVLGTERVVVLCRRMMGLKALVHVSTCYSNCDLEEVDEVVYPPPYDPENILQCVQWMDDELLAHITPKLLGKKPNTYTFTKALAEGVIVKEGAGLPIAIVRPSIVSSTWQEPMSGYLEGLVGPAGVIAAYGKGMLKTLLCDGQKVIDIIPVDLVVNLLIAAAWRASMERKDQPMVYNSCSGVTNPMTYSEIWRAICKEVRRNPPENIVWYPPTEVFTTNHHIHQLSDLLFHSLPAYLMDVLRVRLNKKPMLVRLQQRIRAGMRVTEFVRMNEWRFKDGNTLDLSKCLSKQDQEIFYFDIGRVEWHMHRVSGGYMHDYIMGVRQHIHKEHPDTIPQSRVWLNRLLWVQRATKLAALLLVTLPAMYILF